MNSWAPVIGIAVTSAMDFPPTCTASIVGFSRAPPQAGHGVWRMYCS
ncbi:Uncharacterised protein [Mycobacteroides abscessus subsp. abscessus]|nr:Uncharacterised protein [Mycobacteroides abscessus subsp. abscessus]